MAAIVSIPDEAEDEEDCKLVGHDVLVVQEGHCSCRGGGSAQYSTLPCSRCCATKRSFPIFWAVVVFLVVVALVEIAAIFLSLECYLYHSQHQETMNQLAQR